MRPKTRDDFDIAIICALPLEADAVEALFDERYDRFGQYYGKQPGDANAYLNGRIGEHNVVLCYLPGMGKGSAASVASSMKVSYTRVQLALVVGICGGAPSPGHGEIFLGDVLISDSVIEYDFGRQYPGGFRRKTDVKDTLGRPNREIRTLLAGLRSKYARQEIQEQADQQLQMLSKEEARWNRPRMDDVLFAASYLHKHPKPAPSSSCICTNGISEDICQQALEETCDELGCDKGQVIRCRRKSLSPVAIHIGTIACADTVMKSGQHRDAIAKEEKVIGFEMEGAGVWDNCSCVIIKGVCDYADSHKSKAWQEYAAATGACAAKAFLELWKPQERETTSPRHLMIPFMRNPRFVGRHNEIQQVIECIHSSHGPKKLAITGLGGVGKTQIALEVACRVRDTDVECSIFWIPCTSYEAFEQAIMSIMQTVGVEVDATNSKQHFKTYFSQNEGNWLLIFDNADDTRMWIQGSENNPPLMDFLPSRVAGHIIFTSRNRELAVDLSSSSLVQIQELDEETGMALLEKSLLPHQLPDSSTAIALLEQLTFLPLAISQATAYITKKGISVSDYLMLFDEQEEDVVQLLSKDFGDDGRYKETQSPVAKTWLISFLQVQSLSPLAAQLLSLMACIDPRNIPRDFLIGSESKLKVTDALGILDAFSFTTTQSGNGSISLHRLVHLATRNWIRREGCLSDCIARVTIRLDMIFRPAASTDQSRQTWRELIPHALSLFDDNEFENINVKYVHLIERVGQWLGRDGKYNEAKSLLLKSTKLYRRILGSQHPLTLSSMSKIALVYLNQGRSMEAEELYMQVKDRLTEMDPKHPFTLQILGMIAATYMAQGKWKEPEDILKQVKDAQQQLIGPEHPDTITTMANLAMVYLNQKRWKESEKMIVKVIDIEKRVVGPDHPNILVNMNILATVFSRQGHLKDAEELLIQTSNARRILGPDHHTTLITKSNFAWILMKQGRLKEAEELFVQARDGLKNVLGSDHPDTLITSSTFAWVLMEKGQLKEAEGLLVRALDGLKKVLGPDHPDTLTTQSNLAWALEKQGRLEEAEELLLRTLDTLKTLLGPEHPHTLVTKSNLAWALKKQGRSKDAEELLVQTLDTLRKVLGSNHPHTLTSMHRLAIFWQSVGEIQGALALIKECVDRRSEVLGREHYATVESFKSLQTWEHKRKTQSLDDSREKSCEQSVILDSLRLGDLDSPPVSAKRRKY